MFVCIVLAVGNVSNAFYDMFDDDDVDFNLWFD